MKRYRCRLPTEKTRDATEVPALSAEHAAAQYAHECDLRKDPAGGYYSNFREVLVLRGSRWMRMPVLAGIGVHYVAGDAGVGVTRLCTSLDRTPARKGGRPK
jgi:hypothetical protein